MEELKALFGDKSLSYDEFEQKLKSAGADIKLANLKNGNYVDKAKYEKLNKSFTEYKSKYSDVQQKASSDDYNKLKSQYDDLTSKYNKLQVQHEQSERMGMINNASVNPKFAKIVYNEVSALAKDGKKDFQTTLKEYLDENKELLKTKGTFVNLQNGTSSQKSDNEKFNEQIRRIRG